MEAILILLCFLVLTVVSFLFSLSETSIIALSKIRLRHLVSQKVKHSQNIQRLTTKLDKIVTAILAGNNFVNVAMSAIVTAVFVRLFTDRLGVALATFMATIATTFFILVVCEITPKVIALRQTERFALSLAPVLEKFVDFLGPVANIFVGISNFLVKMLKIPPAKKATLVTEEELRTMIEIGKEEGILSEEEKKMLHRIFEFGDTRVREVMVPKEQMIAVDMRTSPEELLNVFVEKGHARLPVYEGSIDNIVGVIYARDLLYILRDKGLFVLQDLVHAAYYVMANMRVNELLKKFQTDHMQIAVIVDERRKTLGMVTLEDLTEEIVGEIAEEQPMRQGR